MSDTSAAIGPLVSPTDFVGLDDIIHFAAAGETPLLERHRRTLDAFARDKAGGMRGRERLIARAEESKALAARLLGVEADEVGLALNVAQAVNVVARTVAERGAGNVVMHSWEYPSMMFPWARLRGIEVRAVPNASYEVALEDLAAAVDAGTRAIVTSHVSYFTGERVDLAEMRALADSVGALLLVDASHSAGVLPVDARQADFLFTCCYKWLLGVHGVALAVCNRKRQPDWTPRESGWTSVVWQDSQVRSPVVELVDDGRLFEMGNAAWLCGCVLAGSLEYLLDVGAEAIEQHVMDLSGRLRSRLREAGLAILGPDDDERRSGNVAFEIDDEERWRQGLERAGVLAWVGDRRVRLSPFIYNDSHDVDGAADVIQALSRGKE